METENTSHSVSTHFAHTSTNDVMAKLGHIERVVVFRPKQLQSNFEVFEVIYSESASEKGALTVWIVDNIHGLCGQKTGDNAKEFKFQELGQLDIFAGASPSGHFHG